MIGTIVSLADSCCTKGAKSQPGNTTAQNKGQDQGKSAADLPKPSATEVVDTQVKATVDRGGKPEDKLGSVDPAATIDRGVVGVPKSEATPAKARQWRYPFGDRGTDPDTRNRWYREFADKSEFREWNNQYGPGLLPASSDKDDTGRTGGARPEGWSNIQDVGAWYHVAPYTGHHSGEDWNYQPKADEIKQLIYAAATGTVIEIKKLSKSDKPESTGWIVVLKHDLPVQLAIQMPGEKDPFQFQTAYTLYGHIGPPLSDKPLKELKDTTEADFNGVQIVKSQPVKINQPIGYVAPIEALDPHFHFEVRIGPVDWKPTSTGVWPNKGSTGGYYRSFEDMWKDRIVDASDFIDWMLALEKAKWHPDLRTWELGKAPPGWKDLTGLDDGGDKAAAAPIAQTAAPTTAAPEVPKAVEPPPVGRPAYSLPAKASGADALRKRFQDGKTGDGK
ncbi:MAG: M23 family metallopeptidase [Phycisphaeraceae bacterium]|nr:M23 family metallopeptidase [Phycisphaeraceae bacterium]